jgi:hypothetical protein
MEGSITVIKNTLNKNRLGEEFGEWFSMPVSFLGDDDVII